MSCKPTGCKIRKMLISDYDAVYSLWLSCKGMGLNDLDDSREGIMRFLKRNPDTCFAAETESGCIIGAIMAGNDGRRGYIYHTAVHPDYRNHGIGRALAEEAVAALKKCGINKAALVVFAHNTDGSSFWEKLGFTARNDIIYRDRVLTEMKRIDT